jgi:DNA polymerase V
MLTIRLLTPVRGSPMPLALYASPVQAGFPSPADDHLEKRLDLNDHLVRHPAATFFVLAEGSSMTRAGIQSGDLLVVDRSLEAVDGDVVVAVLDGEFTVKRLRIRKGRPMLCPEADGYQPIVIGEDARFEVWGVVSAVVHSFRGNHVPDRPR